MPVTGRLEVEDEGAATLSELFLTFPRLLASFLEVRDDDSSSSAPLSAAAVPVVGGMVLLVAVTVLPTTPNGKWKFPMATGEKLKPAAEAMPL